MKHLLTLGLFLAVCPLLAQNVQRGSVLEYNEKNEKKPLQNVEITVDNATSAVSDLRGDYTLRFRQVSVGQKVQVLAIEKAGYELFNQEDVDEWRVMADGRVPFNILMYRSDALRELRDRFTAMALRVLQSQKGGTRDGNYTRRLENLEQYIDRFVRVDMTQVIDAEKKILKLVNKGRFDEALKQYDMQKIPMRRASVYRQCALLRMAGGTDNEAKAMELLRSLAYADTTMTSVMSDYAHEAYLAKDYTAALAAYRTLSNSARAQSDLVTLAKARINEGAILNYTRRNSDGTPLLQQAVALLDSIRLEQNDTLLYLSDIAHGCHYLGLNSLRQRNVEEGRGLLMRGVWSLRALRDVSSFANLQPQYASQLVQTGSALCDTYYIYESEVLIQEGISVLDVLYTAKPYTYVGQLANAWSNLGRVYFKMGAAYNEKSEDCYLKAGSYYDRAVEYDSTANIRQQMSNLHHLGDLYKSKGDFAKSVDCYEPGRIYWEANDDKSEQATRFLTETYADMGEALYKIGRYDEALHYDSLSYIIAKPRYDQNPELFKDMMGTCLLHLVNTYISLDRYEEAFDYVRKAMEVDPEYPETRRRLEQIRRKLNK
ncbi:MAG: tetratricopeptide repeat protein [Bacteroidales bacterium]|nr:tetratricopeptide repeat protein [Candidatus Liminaster caballi]